MEFMLIPDCFISNFFQNVNLFVSYPYLEGGSSCTNDTSYAVGPWLGSGPEFTIVDTPGFQDSDDVSQHH